ncbi:hypothetical protein DPMN_146991 [Dreissena polymorpha]|uniref:Uncharacterized protein n=1 Tax=Dreissena polymorpha TaxID=45954 RepID=A0A9D4F6W5_DREPO|nr:hypothetical protein DPMN_146991 [Dreissena polymorpha]
MGYKNTHIKDCTASTTCTDLDANSECSGSTSGSLCQCKTDYVIGSAGLCVLPVTSTVCTATGTECNSITNALCDTTALKCKCGGITAMVENKCTGKACTASTTCTALDANSQCSGTTTGSVCQCSAGYLMGSDGKCASGAATVLVSVTMLFACFITRLL